MNLKNIPQKVVKFFKEVQLEVKKVNWPTKQETLKYTLTVLGISIAIGIYLGLVDFGFTAFLNKIVSIKQ